MMNTVVLDVRSLQDSLADAVCAMQTGHGDAEARISFASPALLWQVLGARRRGLLELMRGAGEVSVAELARRSGGEASAVREDIEALLDAGIVQNSADGRVVFPYDALKVEFMLKAA